MLFYNTSILLKQFSYLSLTQPHRFILKMSFDFNLTVFGLIYEYFIIHVCKKILFSYK